MPASAPPSASPSAGTPTAARSAPRGGQYLIPLSAERRAAAGVAAGDEVDVDIEVDTEPRTVEEPPELTAALDADPEARRRFDAMSYSHQLQHVLAVADAKTEGTRERRVAAVLAAIKRMRGLPAPPGRMERRDRGLDDAAPQRAGGRRRGPARLQVDHRAGADPGRAGRRAEPDRPAAARPGHRPDGRRAARRSARGSRTTAPTGSSRRSPCAGRPRSTPGWPARCSASCPPVAALADGAVPGGRRPAAAGPAQRRPDRRAAPPRGPGRGRRPRPGTVHRARHRTRARRPGASGRQRVLADRLRAAAGGRRASSRASSSHSSAACRPCRMST